MAQNQNNNGGNQTPVTADQLTQAVDALTKLIKDHEKASVDRTDNLAKDFNKRFNEVMGKLPEGKKEGDKPKEDTGKPDETKKEKTAEKPAAVRTNSADTSVAPAASETGLVATGKAVVKGTTIAASTVTAAGGLVPSIYSLPILEKIPYLPQISSSIYGGLNSVANYFGINTGAAATKASLAYLPTATMPIALGLGGLYGLGKLNEKITGRPQSAGLRGIPGRLWNGVRSVYDIPAWGLKKTLGYGKDGAGWLWKAAGAPGRFMRDKVWTPVVKPLIKPTLAGVGGAFAGATLAAAAGAATPLLPATALGFFGMNYLKNKGYLGGKNAANPAYAG